MLNRAWGDAHRDGSRKDFDLQLQHATLPPLPPAQANEAIIWNVEDERYRFNVKSEEPFTLNDILMCRDLS